MRKGSLIAAGLAASLLAACGQGTKTEVVAEGTDESTSDGAGMPADWKATDACSIIDKAEMGAAMKSPVTETALSLVSEASGANAATSECSYTLADGGKATVMTRWSPIADHTPDTIATTRSAAAASLKAFSQKEVEDVPGVGIGAFLVPGINQFNVFLDPRRMVMITISSAPDAEAKDRAVALAKAAGA